MTERILLIAHGWPAHTIGGTGVVVDALARGLLALGHDVCVAHPGAEQATEPYAVRGVAAVRPRGWRGGWAADPTATERLFADYKPTIVDVHHLTGWPLTLPHLAREAGAHVVLTLHDYAIVCGRGQLVHANGQRCEGPSTHRCGTCLAPFLGPWARLSGQPSHRDYRDLRARHTAAETALRTAHVRIAPSADLARRMTQLGAGPVSVAPLPLAKQLAPAAAPPPGPVRFLFCSAVLPTKGPHLALAAFARLPEGAATLTIAGPAPTFPGDPSYAARLRRAAASVLGVTVRDAVPREDIQDVLAAHDVLVLPSLWPENSPLIVREATAIGLRVIVSRYGGAAELDPLARVVAPDLPDALYHAMRAECATGRGRRAPLSWPSPVEVAAERLANAYRR